MRTVLMKFIVRGLASGCRDNRALKQRKKKSGEFLIWGQKAKLIKNPSQRGVTRGNNFGGHSEESAAPFFQTHFTEEATSCNSAERPFYRAASQTSTLLPTHVCQVPSLGCYQQPTTQLCGPYIWCRFVCTQSTSSTTYRNVSLAARRRLPKVAGGQFPHSLSALDHGL